MVFEVRFAHVRSGLQIVADAIAGRRPHDFAGEFSGAGAVAETGMARGKVADLRGAQRGMAAESGHGVVVAPKRVVRHPEVVPAPVSYTHLRAHETPEH